jgi:putative heme degradation protein
MDSFENCFREMTCAPGQSAGDEMVFILRGDENVVQRLSGAVHDVAKDDHLIGLNDPFLALHPFKDAECILCFNV